MKHWIWIALLLTATASAQSWTRTEVKDAFTDESSVRFTIEGKFITPPQRGKLASPFLALECRAGKLKLAVVGIGAPVELLEENRTVVKYRRDEGIPKEEAWAVSSDFRAVLPWPQSVNEMFFGPARKLRVLASELQAADVVMDFDIPDMGTVASECGLAIYPKK